MIRSYKSNKSSLFVWKLSFGYDTIARVEIPPNLSADVHLRLELGAFEHFFKALKTFKRCH